MWFPLKNASVPLGAQATQRTSPPRPVKQLIPVSEVQFEYLSTRNEDLIHIAGVSRAHVTDTMARNWSSLRFTRLALYRSAAKGKPLRAPLGDSGVYN